MNTQSNNQSIRTKSKSQLLGRYGSAVLVTFVIWSIELVIDTVMLLFYGNEVTLFQEITFDVISLISAVFMGILSFGSAFFYLNIVAGRKVYSSMIFQPFQNRLDLALKLSLFLCGIRFITQIPYLVLNYLFQSNGNTDYRIASLIAYAVSLLVYYIFSLFFSQVTFIFFDLPNYSFRNILRMSLYLMKGNKWRFFCLQLGFLPLLLLGLLSCGIGMLWIIPYMDACYANFYLSIVREKSA